MSASNQKQPPANARQISLEHKHFSGPLPLASELANYEKILPGAADRIIVMAEKQSEHRQSMEKAVIKTQNINSTLGVFSAFIICILTVGIGGYGVFNGGGIASAAFGASGLVAICGVFIYGTNKNNSNK